MLIAIKDEGTTYIAQSIADVTAVTSKDDLILDENVPFWKVSGVKRCYAACGSTQFSADLLRIERGLFKGIENAYDVLTDTIPKMRKLLEDGKLVDARGSWNNVLVIAKDDKIYYVDQSFMLVEIDNFIVKGRGEEFISSGLEREKHLPLEERIRKVVRCCDELHSEYRFPIVLHNCATGRKKILK